MEDKKDDKTKKMDINDNVAEITLGSIIIALNNFNDGIFIEKNLFY